MTASAGPWSDLSRPPLRAAALQRAITGDVTGVWRALEVLPQTGSTNADLAGRARAGEAAGIVLATDHQTAGRGRMSRQWVTPPRSSVIVSVLLAPTVPVERWGWLPLLAGLAVTRVAITVGGLPAVLKWPNDVLVPEPGSPFELSKLAGVLAELVDTPSGPAVVLGVGINVGQDRSELPVPEATSLRLAGAAGTDRDTVLRAYLRELAETFARWDAAGGLARTGGVAAAYREACSTIGRRVEVHLPGRPALVGLADGVDDDGRLQVLDDEGVEHRFAAGDVVHVRPDPGVG